MSVVLTYMALAGVMLRIRRRLFTRAEAAVLSIVLVTIGLVFAQAWVAAHALPEKRYWIQASVLLLPWAAWLVLQVRRARALLAVVVLGLAINDVILVARGHIPGSNKNVRMAAVAWAAPLIRADYRGPLRDATGYANTKDYHQPNRPVVASPARFKRLAYEVGGRPSMSRIFGEIDRPDYIFGEAGKLTAPTNGCMLLASQKIHAKTFELWRCPAGKYDIMSKR